MDNYKSDGPDRIMGFVQRNLFGERGMVSVHVLVTLVWPVADTLYWRLGRCKYNGYKLQMRVNTDAQHATLHGRGIRRKPNSLSTQVSGCSATIPPQYLFG